jgi:hypothetical protein
MDLKVFYQKIREIESSIPEESVITISLATSDGGKEGVLSEVSRRIAARNIVEGKGRLASREEADAYRAQVAADRKAIEHQALLSQARFTVVTQANLDPVRPPTKQKN